MENNKAHYGLITAITMIIGIVVGSGIFFKSDDVLNYTGGSIGLGVLVLCIGAFSIIFGCLTLSELSIRTKRNGGFVGYFEEFVSKKTASGFGWFQTFVYFPSLIAVIAWVTGIYTCALFGIKDTLENQILVGIGFMVLIYAVNILSVKIGGYFQNVTTVIKLIPLLSIALIGVFLGKNNAALPEGVALVSKSSVGFGWLAALAPVAFSYDGWVISISITNEVKNPEKNMPLALVIGPLAVLAVYLMYFLGITNMLGSEYIMSTGNAAVNEAGTILLGQNGSKILMIFIIISIMGVLNGVILGSLRMPQALASKGMIPNAEKIAKINPKYELSLSSCFISFIVAAVWLLLHYLTQKTGIIGKSDVSEIAIVFSYICYTLLYFKVILLKKENVIKSSFKGYLCPLFAILGSAIILIGGIVSNPFYVPVFIILCLIVGLIGYSYYKEGNSKN